jgi:hypothetical protein
MGAWGYGETESIALERMHKLTDAPAGLFQSDHDFDLVSDIDGDFGLHQMEEQHQAEAKAEGDKKPEDRIHYTIYAPACSDVELVRQHLDNGALAYVIADKTTKLLSKPKEFDIEDFDFYDPCYVFVLLGACAMMLGCTLPQSYLVMLKKVYTEGGLMPDALKQMHKALFGPNGFQNGVPYDFECKDLLETANSMEDAEPTAGGVIGMNVIGPGGFFNTGMGDSKTSAIIKELRDQHNNPNACGGCGVEDGEGGKDLLQCSKCKERRYCGAACQKKSWKVHKKVCKPVKK